jgi:hypothetical protein
MNPLVVPAIDMPVRRGKLQQRRHALATAARHGIGALDALTTAFQGRPWIPQTG